MKLAIKEKGQGIIEFILFLTLIALLLIGAVVILEMLWPTG
jgi:Flp pilus assembly pilin Flp